VLEEPPEHDVEWDDEKEKWNEEGGVEDEDHLQQREQRKD